MTALDATLVCDTSEQLSHNAPEDFMSRSRMFALVPVLVLAAACGGKADTPALATQYPVAIDVANVDRSVDPPPSVHKIAKGKEVQISVYSTTADVVHVHGYEKTGAVQAGSMVLIGFIADKTGLFDVDLQRSHVKLLQIQVS
jgi:hypothetical protein